MIDQVFSAGLAEFDQGVHPALVGVFQYFLNRAVWPQVSLDDDVFDPHGGIDHFPGRYEAHTPDHGIELHQFGDRVGLVGQGISQGCSVLWLGARRPSLSAGYVA